MWHKIRLLVVAICLIAATWIVISVGLPERSATLGLYRIGQTPIAAEVGALAPPIEAFDVTGKRFSLAGLRGHAVVINFWATWCGPCITEMPMIQAAHQRYRGMGLRFVGVDVGESAADVLNWTQHYGLTYDFVVDAEGRLSYLYMTRELPTTFIVGPDGMVRQVTTGPLNADQFEAVLHSLSQ